MNAIGRAAAGLFLLVLPINHTMALRMVSLLLAGLVVLWGWLATRRQHPVFPLKLPLGIWVGTVLLSLAWSVDPLYSLQEIKTEVLYGFIAFGAFFSLTRDRETAMLWLHLLMLSLLATLAIGQWNILALHGKYYDWDGLHGYVSYSTYLACIAPILFLWFQENCKNPALRVSGALLLALFLWIAYLNGNRMFWVSFAAVVLTMAVLWWRRCADERRARQWLLLVVAGLLALSAAMFVTTAMKRYEAEPTMATAPAGEYLAETVGKSERYVIWSYWLDRIAERPLTGVGFGRDLPHRYYKMPEGWNTMYFAHAHNLILDYALQMGILGVAASCFLFAAIGREFWRLYRHPGSSAWKIGAGGLGLLVAMLSKNMTDDLFWRTDALLFWALVGILLGWGRRIVEQDRGSERLSMNGNRFSGNGAPGRDSAP